MFSNRVGTFCEYFRVPLRSLIFRDQRAEKRDGAYSRLFNCSSASKKKEKIQAKVSQERLEPCDEDHGIQLPGMGVIAGGALINVKR